MWVKMEYFKDSDGFYRISRYREDGTNDVTPWAFGSKSAAISYIAHHGFSVEEVY